MNDKRANLRERSQRFRRRIRGEDRAVSPVVATLILILIAVAAAAALYLWLVAWQGNITAGIGQPGAQYTVTVGGSTSVYPFSAVGVKWFQQNNSNVVISDNQGGTTAGMIAVCHGSIDVGAASSPQTVAGLQTSPDNCPLSADVTITTIAYDAVDIVINSANPHGVLSMNYDTLAAIYDGASTTTATLVPTTIDGVTTGSGILDVAPWNVATLGSSSHTSLAWDQIPATVAGYVFAIGALHEAGPLATTTTTTEGIDTSVAPAGVACGVTTTLFNDICDASVFGGATSGTPCGFLMCAGGSGAFVATANIVPVERSDGSGTTQTFEAKLLSATSGSGFAGSFAALGYSGCGGNNVLSDCGISVPTQGNGNPGVAADVAGSQNSIGYVSDGIARSAAGIGTGGIVPFLAVGQGSVALPAGLVYGAVSPSLGAGGTIAAGILGSSTVNQYSGWRPFEFVTLNPPTGEVERFFQFVLDPANNINIATASGEVSVYSI